MARRLALSLLLLLGGHAVALAGGRARAPPLRTPRPPRMVHPVKLPFSAQDYLKSTGRHTLAADWIASGLPRWVTLIDEALFVVASGIFIRGSFDFYPSATYAVYLEGCELFILGSLMQLGLALFATYEIYEDARRSGRNPETSLLLEQTLYVAGSVFFTVGTILFTPPIGFLSSLGGIRTPPQPAEVSDAVVIAAAAPAAAEQSSADIADVMSSMADSVVGSVADLADTAAKAAESFKIGFFGTSVELQVAILPASGFESIPSHPDSQPSSRPLSLLPIHTYNPPHHPTTLSRVSLFGLRRALSLGEIFSSLLARSSLQSPHLSQH